MAKFSEQLQIKSGVTAIIGSGGKTTLMYRLAQELSQIGSVIVTTTTHIWPPDHIPVLGSLSSKVQDVLCVGTPCENGKLSAPKQSIEELAALADYVLVEADGSAGLPIKAHAAHEPVVPICANQTVCVLGAAGLDHPMKEVVHRPQIFFDITQSDLATPEAVAQVLQQEALFDRLVINQAECNPEAAKFLAALMDKPTLLATLEKGEILC